MQKKIIIGATLALVITASLGVLLSKQINKEAFVQTPPKIVQVSSEADYIADFSDDRQLVGASQNIFVGKVIKEAKSVRNYTQFEVQAIYDVKGKLQGQVVNVGVTGGYRDGVFYVANGNTYLASGSTYLLATRYDGISDEGSYRLINFDSPVSWKLLSQDSNLSNAQLQAIAQSDPRVKQLEAAYPNEILNQADIQNHRTMNSYISTHSILTAPPPPPAAPSSTVELNPPVISDLTATAASTSVAISWTTNKPATSQLLFGSSTAMTAQVPSDANATTAHSIQISNLVPGTTYYYEAQSTDPSGKVGSTSQQSFTTTAAN